MDEGTEGRWLKEVTRVEEHNTKRGLMRSRNVTYYDDSYACRPGEECRRIFLTNDQLEILKKELGIYE